MARDPYDILGVPRNAGDEEIRRAYRRLAKQEHPDTDGGDENYFCRLNDAYESIRTPARRLAQARERGRADRQSSTGAGAASRRPAWWSPPGGGAPGTARGPGGRPRGRSGSIFGGDLFGLFERVFCEGLADVFNGADPGVRPRGAGPRGAGPRGADGRHRGRHYRIELRLTPKEARRGSSRELELADGAHRIDVPPGVRHGDMLSFTESTSAGERLSVDVEVVVRLAAR